ncbi:MAG TPA: TraK family protein [Candidatus Sulfotelmatobacter sp.]|nr:TraK family protein [Candidatus Sulfotelmatobacter sp.]
MSDSLSDALDALCKELPRAKTRWVKRFLPQIERALAAGHTRKAVWERLHQQRADLGYKEFCVYLGRLRESKAEGADESRIQREETAAPSSQPYVHDPCANLRRAEAERVVFNWRGTEDLDELVYGKKRTDKAGG